MADTEHWTNSADALRGFWRQAKTVMGFTEDEVHSVIGVGSLDEFDGTLGEALNILAAERNRRRSGGARPGDGAGDDAAPPPPSTTPVPADAADADDDNDSADDDSLVEACYGLPELPIVAWTTFQSSGGYEWSFTIRAGLPNALARRAIQGVMRQIREFEQAVELSGGKPLLDGRKQLPLAAPAPAAPAPAPAPAPTAAPAQPIPPATPAKQEQVTEETEETFDAEDLIATVNRGKTYWKVRGGRFSKFGVTIWPEVLVAAGFSNLDPMVTYNLAGWRATALVADGKPQKITRLMRVAP